MGYGSHLFADMMTLGGVRLFWPSRVIAVFPGRDDYRVRTGGNSERVFVAFALVFALLLYPVSRVGFEGLSTASAATTSSTAELRMSQTATPSR